MRNFTENVYDNILIRIFYKLTMDKNVQALTDV